VYVKVALPVPVTVTTVPYCALARLDAIETVVLDARTIQNEPFTRPVKPLAPDTVTGMPVIHLESFDTIATAFAAAVTLVMVSTVVT
jgi:hypothetical protein